MPRQPWLAEQQTIVSMYLQQYKKYQLSLNLISVTGVVTLTKGNADVFVWLGTCVNRQCGELQETDREILKLTSILLLGSCCVYVAKSHSMTPNHITR